MFENFSSLSTSEHTLTCENRGVTRHTKNMIFYENENGINITTTLYIHVY